MRVLPLLLLLLLLCCAPAQAGQSAQLIISHQPGVDGEARVESRQAAQVSFSRHLLLPRAQLVSVPQGEVGEALRRLREDPRVAWAEVDAPVRASAGSTDPYFPYLWALHNTGQTVDGIRGVADADVDAPEAWTHASGEGVRVAIVDSGVDGAHPELQGQSATNPGEMGLDLGGAERSSNQRDDDLNGLVDDWRGWDFVSGDNLPQDGSGHGSHVAGTLLAANGNGTGITGLAPDARYLALRALNDQGEGTISTIVNAFAYAGEQGVRIVNASLGSASTSQALTEVIQRYPQTLFVAAAGNENLNLDSHQVLPCEVPAANVICVGSSDQRDTRAPYSNYSSSSVDLHAPGSNILSSSLGDYYLFSGTSMATPQVSATLALMLSRSRGLSAQELKSGVLTTSERVSALAPYAAYGRVNAHLALLNLPADSDGDRVSDSADACPGLFGLESNAGCPEPAPVLDQDGDGITGLSDRCPSQPGPASNQGCPLPPPPPDGDGDGTPDQDDLCPALAGARSAGGCPPPSTPSDQDGDGIQDPADSCPNQAGPASNQGCPQPQPADQDGDGSPDPADRCPSRPGPLANYGCPVAQLPPLLKLTSVKSSLSKCVRRAPCRRRLSLRISNSRAASLKVTLYRQRCAPKCVWRKLNSRSSKSMREQRVLKLEPLLSRGLYRVRARAQAGGQSSPVLSRRVRVP